VAKNVPVVQFALEAVAPTGNLAYFLGASHTLDASDHSLEDRHRRLVESTKSLMSKSPGKTQHDALRNL
jgi:hypothetical protein